MDYREILADVDLSKAIPQTISLAMSVAWLEQAAHAMEQVAKLNKNKTGIQMLCLALINEYNESSTALRVIMDLDGERQTQAKMEKL